MTKKKEGERRELAEQLVTELMFAKRKDGREKELPEIGSCIHPAESTTF
jgi:hypothetical protein